MNFKDFNFDNLPLFCAAVIEKGELVHYCITIEDESFSLVREESIIARFNSYEGAYGYYMAEFN